jgi:hypothetical protein
MEWGVKARRVVMISFCLLLLAGPKGQAQAATAGFYRCFVSQGSLDDGQSSLLPIIFHHNPNGVTQHIRRIRIFDSEGNQLADQRFAVGEKTVPPRGSIQIAATTAPPGGDTIQGLQFVVNWSQATDAGAPVPKVGLFHFDVSFDPPEVFSVAQTACP